MKYIAISVSKNYMHLNIENKNTLKRTGIIPVQVRGTLGQAGMLTLACMLIAAAVETGLLTSLG